MRCVLQRPDGFKQFGHVFGEASAILCSIQDDIRPATLLAHRHLASDPSKCLGSRETVSFLETGNLCLLVGRNDDDCVHSCIDTGLEKQGNIVYHDGARVALCRLLGQSYLLPSNTRVDDLFELPKLRLVVKDHLAEHLPIDGSIKTQDRSSKSADDCSPGRLARLDDVMGELIRIDHCCTASGKHLRDGTFPRCQSACEPNEDHGDQAYHVS